MEIILTAEEVKEYMQGQLSGFPWGGHVVAVRQNEWDEWIADCRVYGAYGNPGNDDYHFYSYGDPQTPIRQFMIHVSVQLSKWDAKNDKRLPTFIESGHDLDEYAPPSPYIIEPIKAEISRKINEPNPFIV